MHIKKAYNKVPLWFVRFLKKGKVKAAILHNTIWGIEIFFILCEFKIICTRLWAQYFIAASVLGCTHFAICEKEKVAPFGPLEEFSTRETAHKAWFQCPPHRLIIHLCQDFQTFCTATGLIWRCHWSHTGNNIKKDERGKILNQTNLTT